VNENAKYEDVIFWALFVAAQVWIAADKTVVGFLWLAGAAAVKAPAWLALWREHRKRAP
jgi:hypothetical protein